MNAWNVPHFSHDLFPYHPDSTSDYSPCVLPEASSMLQYQHCSIETLLPSDCKCHTRSLHVQWQNCLIDDLPRPWTISLRISARSGFRSFVPTQQSLNVNVIHPSWLLRISTQPQTGRWFLPGRFFFKGIPPLLYRFTRLVQSSI